MAAIVPFVQLSFWRGFLVDAVHGVDVSYVAGLAVAGVVYYLLARSINRRAEIDAVAASDDELTKLGLLSPAAEVAASEP